MNLGEGKPCWVCFLYVRLPNLCFYRGVLGHTLKECDVVDAAKLDHAKLPYGQWLRAGLQLLKGEGSDIFVTRGCRKL